MFYNNKMHNTSYRKSHKSKKQPYLGAVLTLILFFLIFVYILNDGLNRHMEMECYNWEYDNPPYYSHWQIAQCKHFGITLK